MVNWTGWLKRHDDGRAFRVGGAGKPSPSTNFQVSQVPHLPVNVGLSDLEGYVQNNWDYMSDDEKEYYATALEGAKSKEDASNFLNVHGYPQEYTPETTEGVVSRIREEMQSAKTPEELENIKAEIESQRSYKEKYLRDNPVSPIDKLRRADGTLPDMERVQLIDGREVLIDKDSVVFTTAGAYKWRDLVDQYSELGGPLPKILEAKDVMTGGSISSSPARVKKNIRRRLSK